MRRRWASQTNQWLRGRWPRWWWCENRSFWVPYCFNINGNWVVCERHGRTQLPARSSLNKANNLYLLPESRRWWWLGVVRESASERAKNFDYSVSYDRMVRCVQRIACGLSSVCGPPAVTARWLSSLIVVFNPDRCLDELQLGTVGFHRSLSIIRKIMGHRNQPVF